MDYLEKQAGSYRLSVGGGSEEAPPCLSYLCIRDLRDEELCGRQGSGKADVCCQGSGFERNGRPGDPPHTRTKPQCTKQATPTIMMAGGN
jgi:hypothetical protein